MGDIVLHNGEQKFLELYNKVVELSNHVEKLVNEKASEKISPEQAAEEWGVTPQTIYAKIKKGTIKGSKAGGRKIYIKRSDLENALTEIKSLKYKR